MNKLDRLILIDDNEITNFFNEDIVSELGLAPDVITFKDPNMALAYFIENDEELSALSVLVFCDIKMPEITGFELLEEMEERELNFLDRGYFCMLTSSNMVKDKEQFAKFPYVKHFMEKPLDHDKIQTVVDTFNLGLNKLNEVQ